MSWKSFACLAALAAMASPALALPSLELVDNGDDTASINVIATDTGSIGVEAWIDFAGSGVTLGAITVNSAVFDTANPGDSPFINGLDAPLGGDAEGTDATADTLFASYGSVPSLAPGTYELLSFGYTGSGDLTVAGVAAQIEVLTSGLTDTETVGGSGGIFGDFEPDGDVDIIDFGLFADAFGSASGDANYDVRADEEPDGDVDIIDFGKFADNFGIGTSTAIPEPATALLGLIGVACLSVRRSV